MKKTLVCCSLLTALTACSYMQAKHPFLTPVNPVVTVVTNTVVQVVTNQIEKPYFVTNTITERLPGQPPIVVTRVDTNYVQVPQIVQVPVQVPVYLTNWQYAVSSGASNVLSTAGDLAPLVPQPFGGILGALAGVAGMGLGLYAKVMSGKYRQVISAVAAGVETGADSVTKAAIQNAAAGAGVQQLLDPIVQAVSSKMVDAPAAPAVPSKPA